MPIRINLKELFGSDSQGVTVDKLNFNFNRLLELGIGEQGIQGIQGPIGSAGPSGITGPAGTRGSLWYVGTSTPTAGLPTGLLTNDLHVDGSTGNQYQWDGVNWNLVTDLGAIISAQISTASSIAFVRDLQIADPQQRFITFKNRNDVSNDTIGGSSTNDMLFLNNFDESGITETETDLYTSLARINTDVVSTGGTPQRYHLQLGSYFSDVSNLFGNGAGTPVISKTKHDLKFRHLVDDLGGSSRYIYIGRLSTSISESDPIIDLDYNSMFELVSAKWDGAVGSELVTRIGSIEALSEYSPGPTAVNGIAFNIGSVGVAMGLALDYQKSANEVFNNKNYLFLEGDDATIDATFVNTKLIQDGGNIIQAGTSEFRDLDISTSSNQNAATVRQGYGNAGIVKIDGNILTIDSTSSTTESPGIPLSDSSLWGRLSYYDVTNPSDTSLVGTWTSNGLGLSNTINGIGVSDVKMEGNFVYVVNNTNDYDYSNVAGYSLADLQVFEYNPRFSQDLSPVKGSPLFVEGKLSNPLNVAPESNGEYQGYHRIEVLGDVAVISTQMLRSFGVSTVGSVANHFYGGGNAVMVLVDISSPREGFKIIDTLNFDPGVHGTPKAHALDLKVQGEYAYSLVIDFQAAGATDLSYNVKMVRGNWREEFDSFWTSVGNPIYNSPSNVNSLNHADGGLNKFGAVEIKGNYLYAFYRNQLHVYDIERKDLHSNQATSGGSENVFIEETSLLYDGDSNMRALEAKVSGNSLYLLYSESSGSDYATSGTSGIIKVDIRDPKNPIVVWKKVLSVSNASRMLISGNNIYVTTSGDFNQSELITLEIDGIESDHVKIGNSEIDSISSLSIDAQKINANILNADNLKTDRFNANGVHFSNETDGQHLHISKGTGANFSNNIVTLGDPSQPIDYSNYALEHGAVSDFYTDRLSTAGSSDKAGNTNAVRIESAGGAPLAILSGNIPGAGVNEGNNFVEWGYRDAYDNAYRSAIIGSLDSVGDFSNASNTGVNFTIRPELGQNLVLGTADSDTGVQILDNNFVDSSSGLGSDSEARCLSTNWPSNEDLPSSRRLWVVADNNLSGSFPPYPFDVMVVVKINRVNVGTDSQQFAEILAKIGTGSDEINDWTPLASTGLVDLTTFSSNFTSNPTINAIIPAGVSWTARAKCDRISVNVIKLGR